MQKCGKKFGIYNNPLIDENKQFLQYWNNEKWRYIIS